MTRRQIQHEGFLGEIEGKNTAAAPCKPNRKKIGTEEWIIMCCLRKRKLFPPRAYFVLNLSTAGGFLLRQKNQNRENWAGEATQGRVYRSKKICQMNFIES